MLTFVAVLHVVVTLILIVLVLLQDSKGGAMGLLGGSGGNTVFGSTGAATFLVKATRWIAIFFAVTSISLAYMTSQKNDSVLDKLPPVSKDIEVKDTAPVSPAQPSDTPNSEANSNKNESAK